MTNELNSTIKNGGRIGIETWDTYFLCRFKTLLFVLFCIYLFAAQFLFITELIFEPLMSLKFVRNDTIISRIFVGIVGLIVLAIAFFLTAFIVLLIGEKYSDSHPQFFCSINRRVLGIFKDDNNESNWKIHFDGKSFDLSEWQEQMNSSIVTWKGQKILMEKEWGNQWESIKKNISNKQ
jgi:hypothetical protein